MSLEISQKISLAVDIVLLTFILVWTERQNRKPGDFSDNYADSGIF